MLLALLVCWYLSNIAKLLRGNIVTSNDVLPEQIKLILPYVHKRIFARYSGLEYFVKHHFYSIELPRRFQSNIRSTYLLVGCGWRGGLMVSALDSGSDGPGSSPGRVIALCSWARHFTLTAPVSTQEYKWVLANLLLGVILRWTSIPSRGE